MENRILQGGIEEIQEIKEQVMTLNRCKEKKRELDAQEAQIENKISTKEQEVADEINNVTRRRREELEKTFDEQINSVEGKLKKLEAKKEKSKKKAIIQRIDSETADFRSEDEELRQKSKEIFKDEKISLMLNNRLFFALFLPRGLGDFGIVLVTLVLAFFVIPFGIYSIFFEDTGTLYLALTYTVVIILFGGIYLGISKVKYRHLEALKKVRDLRRKILESKKKQRNIKRKIEKDEDESHYDLEEFDHEIKEYKNTIAELKDKKKEGLQEFDSLTAEEIKRQIQEANEEELHSLKNQYQKVYGEGKENLEKLNALSLSLSTKYESVMGKEYLKEDRLDAMAKAIEEGKAQNIGEAMDVNMEEKE